MQTAELNRLTKLGFEVWELTCEGQILATFLSCEGAKTWAMQHGFYVMDIWRKEFSHV
jgi:hypothetical protein